MLRLFKFEVCSDLSRRQLALNTERQKLVQRNGCRRIV